jgi:hypothetical protein
MAAALAPLFFSGFFQETQQRSGISGWVWVLLIVILVLLVAWWGYRSSQRASSETPTRAAPVATPVPPAAPDDLVIIEGIGPKIASVLAEAGITTFAQLAQTEVSRLEEILQAANLRLADPASWGEQARLAAAGDFDGLNALQNRLKGGRDITQNT